MTKQELEERRRLLVYRTIAGIERWQETLEALRNYSRANAVASATQNNPVGASYFNGKADGMEELIEKVKTSKASNADEKQL